MPGAQAGSHTRSTTLNQFQQTTLQTGRQADRQTVSTYAQPHMTLFRYCQVLYHLARHGFRARGGQGPDTQETTASAGECFITKSSHAAKILRHLSHMVWLSVASDFVPQDVKPSGPTRWASLFVRSILLASCALPGSPLCPERLCNADLFIRDFQITQTATCSKSQSSGCRPRSRVSAGKITKVPVYKLATDLGFRHVDQVLQSTISMLDDLRGRDRI